MYYAKYCSLNRRFMPMGTVKYGIEMTRRRRKICTFTYSNGFYFTAVIIRQTQREMSVIRLVHLTTEHSRMRLASDRIAARAMSFLAMWTCSTSTSARTWRPYNSFVATTRRQENYK